MMAKNAAAFGVSLALAACTQAPPTETLVANESAPPPPVVIDDPACAYNAAIFLGPPVARQGTELSISVHEPVGAYAPRPIPPEFISNWKASPAGQVKVSTNGAKLSVLPTAKPGANVTISASFCGKREISRTIRIVGKDEPVITGLWREQSKSCTGETPRDPVNELEIKDIGEFSITYFPFESYRDFWGKAEFDYAAGTLAMTTTGGNRVPSNAKLSGKATLTPDGKLVLDGFFLSQPETTGGECRYVFAK